jgi:hypothetical protein
MTRGATCASDARHDRGERKKPMVMLDNDGCHLLCDGGCVSSCILWCATSLIGAAQLGAGTSSSDAATAHGPIMT